MQLLGCQIISFNPIQINVKHVRDDQEDWLPRSTVVQLDQDAPRALIRSVHDAQLSGMELAEIKSAARRWHKTFCLTGEREESRVAA